MRKLFLTAVLAGATLVAPVFTPPAQASPEWLAVGTAFRVGAVHLSFVFGRPSFGYQPAYYYRYDQPVRYRGHQCSRYCFHDAGYDYHHESCPLVAAHFSHYQVDPRWAFSSYAPRFDGYSRDYHGDDSRYYGRYDRDDRNDRYDRHDRYGRNDRYDRQGRYDRGDRHDRDRRYDRRDDRRDHRDRRDDRRDRRSHRHHSGCGHH